MIARLHAFLRDRAASFGLPVMDLLERDAPTGLGAPGIASANRACRLLRARDGWLALNLARPDDLELVPALTQGEGEDWDAIVHHVAHCGVTDVHARAIELQIPVALPGEAAAQPLARTGGKDVPRKVIDMSALWAGPLCAGLLARAGAEVLRIDSIGRPDPTPQSSPLLHARLDAGKAHRALDLRLPADRARLLDLVAQADVLVTSGRPAALARLGLEPARFPHLRWVAITAHGFTGPGAVRVGFGDDCAVAGGLLDRTGETPRFMGDALADPLTGLEAALAVLSGQGGLIDMAMARVAAAYAGAIV
ncbi:CoA transferase [Novosphingobium sp. KCTC 2891]|uniref:CoA transferase n=1 Tax=Novosphingobium sp. KCTC 2891 TaxID=2989730 RepID=UPI002223E20E|nr:CoA transferase [Novosphingobium sp. KCTC 2891]MCW1383655.1 CoA transferase [Novosphingobium sp. KCTC 2891]